MASKAISFKNEGNRLLKEGNIDGAIFQYTKAIDTQPNGPNSHFFYSNRSAAYAKKKDWENALTDAESSLALQPQFIKGYWRKGNALIELGRMDDAQATFRAGLEVDPSNQSLRDAFRQTRVAHLGKSDLTSLDPNRIISAIERDSTLKKSSDWRSKIERKEDLMKWAREDSRLCDLLTSLMETAGGDDVFSNAGPTTDDGEQDREVTIEALQAEIAALRSINLTLNEDYGDLVEQMDSLCQTCEPIAREYGHVNVQSLPEVEELVRMLGAAATLGADDFMTQQEPLRREMTEMENELAEVQLDCQTLHQENVSLRAQVLELMEQNAQLQAMSFGSGHPSPSDDGGVVPEPSRLIPIQDYVDETQRSAPTRDHSNSNEIARKDATISRLRRELRELMSQAEGNPSEEKDVETSLLSHTSCDELRRRLFAVWFESTFDTSEWGSYLDRFVERGLDDLYFWMTLVQFEKEHGLNCHPYGFSVDSLLQESKWIGMTGKVMRRLFVEKINGKTMFSFLRSVGLTEHADRFRMEFMSERRESMDGVHQRLVTDERLRKCGIEKQGHRVRIMWGFFLRQFEGTSG